MSCVRKFRNQANHGIDKTCKGVHKPRIVKPVETVYLPTGFFPADILASLTRVMIAATVGVAPEVPLSTETLPSPMLKNELL